MCLPFPSSRHTPPPTPSSLLSALPTSILQDITAQCTRDLKPLRLSPTVLGSTIRLWLLTLRSGPRPSYPQIPDIDAEPVGVRVAFREYARSAVGVGEAWGRYRDVSAAREEESERLKRGVEWAVTAVRAAKARLSFLRAYDRAYRVPALDVHIRRAEHVLRSVSRSVAEVERRYEEVQKWQGQVRSGT